MDFGNRGRGSDETAVGRKSIQTWGGEKAGRRQGDKLELGHPENVPWETNLASDELENLKIGGAVDPVFQAKASIINSAFQHIGMGRYQWKLFLLCGFGWVHFLGFFHSLSLSPSLFLSILQSGLRSC